MRMLFVTARYLPEVGGTEIHTHEVAQRLVQEGHSVTVLATDAYGKLPAHHVIDGVEVWRVAAWPRHSDYYFAPGIVNKIRQGQWDLLHLQGAHTFVAPLAMAAALSAGIPYVVTFHSGGHSSSIRTILRPLQWMILRPLLVRAQRLVGVSQWEADFFQQQLGLPAQKFTVIPSGSHLPAVTEPMVVRDHPLIVSVGRLERYKGHHRTIEALSILKKEFPQIQLLIVGSGPYESHLRNLAQKLGVANQVEIRSIAGEDRAAMARVLQQADLAILLSNYESQGLSVMEALSVGQSVLTANTTAMTELVAKQMVCATPLHSTPEEVAAAIAAQLRRPSVPHHNIELPTWQGCYDQLVTLYRSVVEDTQ